MNWNNYSHLRGKHAFLSPSGHYWLRYSEEKLIQVFENQQKIVQGTRLHKLAEDLIVLGVSVEDRAEALYAFVNDALYYDMDPEVVLYYSENCFGTADAICYDEKTGILRIHDLKTGVTPGSMHQLMVYAALFVLDYGIYPKEIILRIYQGEEIIEHSPSREELQDVISVIESQNAIIESLKKLLKG